MLNRLKHLTDGQLVDRYVAHPDRAVFGELYQRHVDAVYGFIFKRVGHPETTEDITSDTFMTLLNVIDRFNHQSSFRTFAMGIALNKIRQHWDSLKKHKKVEFQENWLVVDIDDLDEEIESSEHAGLQDRLTSQMHVILEKLPKNYSDVLTLRFKKGLTIKQTAKALRVTENNVKVRQNRAIKQAQQLAQEVV